MRATTVKEAIRLSRLREIYTNAGQYGIALLILMQLNIEGLTGLLAAFAAALFAFNFNTLSDWKKGQVTFDRKSCLADLTPFEIKLVRTFCQTGLGLSVCFIAFLVIISGNWAGVLLLVAYLALGFFYSSSITRWKEVAGLECLSNGLAHSLIFLAGYLQFRPLDSLALFYALSFTLFMGGYYLLHCLEDRESDQSLNIRNLSFYLGFRKSVLVAMASTILSALFFALAATRLKVLWGFVPYYPLVFYLQIKLLRSGDLVYIDRIRRWGRWGGLVLLLILLGRAFPLPSSGG